MTRHRLLPTALLVALPLSLSLLLAACTGDKGVTGATGATGPAGAPGAEGPAGPSGTPGATGAIGPAGPTGAAGTTGAQGPTGATGDVGSSGAQGPTGDTGPLGPDGAGTNLSRYEELPGVVIAINRVAPVVGTTAMVGSTLSVTFTVKKKNGTILPLESLSYSALYVSGPTSSYQMISPVLADVKSRATANADGSYTYVFATAIPATYPAPLNDSTAFGLDDGELQGQALRSGTYTVGLEAYRNYTSGGVTYRDAGNATKDFLFGTATVFEPREVVKNDNCNQCHNQLRAHGGIRRDVKNCVLCHTAGAEDRNVPAVEGGTPGVSIELGVMVHKIHNAKHLPSVLGITTDADGNRVYSATPKPLKYVGYNNTVTDFSTVQFPVWPNFNVVMPQDIGYATGTLTTAQKAADAETRRGVTDCAKCHGDPDGTGPLTAPAQGSFATSKPTRRACGSCHDDIVWANRYLANNAPMPEQTSDGQCRTCHVDSGRIGTVDSHKHPLTNPEVNTGLNFNVTSLVAAGTTRAKLATGDKVAVTFTMKDDAGNTLDPVNALRPLTAMNYVLSGPTTNYNLLMYTSIPIYAFGSGAAASYTMNLPMPVIQEYLGAVAGTSPRTYTTARKPHWNPATLGGLNVALTSVSVRTGAATATTTLAAATKLYQNYIDLPVTAASLGYAANNVLVLDDNTASEEYRTIGKLDELNPNRLWFTTTASYAQLSGLRFAHAAGASVGKATLTAKIYGTDFTVDNANGTFTEAAGKDFGVGNKVLVNYTSDFVMPSVYPQSPYDSLDLDDAFGEWAGKPLSSGTYTFTLWGNTQLCVSPLRAMVTPTIATGTSSYNCSGSTTNPAPATDNTSYRGTSPTAAVDFLYGTATTLTPYANISGGGSTCNKCHNDIYFHGGGRRGFQTCIACHGVAGSELAQGSTGTPTSVRFQQLLHEKHKETFPSSVGGVRDCAMCHGTATTWKEPAPVTHSDPAVQATLKPDRVYTFACSGCHTDTAAQQHIETNTSTLGVESCSVCHAPGREYAIEYAHQSR